LPSATSSMATGIPKTRPVTRPRSTTTDLHLVRARRRAGRRTLRAGVRRHLRDREDRGRGRRTADRGGLLARCERMGRLPRRARHLELRSAISTGTSMTIWTATPPSRPMPPTSPRAATSSSARRRERSNSEWHFIIAPSDGDSVLACGAVNDLNAVASFSSWGPTFDGRMKPEVCARGVSTRARRPRARTPMPASPAPRSRPRSSAAPPRW